MHIATGKRLLGREINQKNASPQTLPGQFKYPGYLIPRLGPRLPIPFFACLVPAGFPSPADDYLDKTLDLNELLIQHPAATFFLRVQGDSMVGAGIYDGDILVVDRALTPRDGKIVVAALNGELTVKRLRLLDTGIELHAENSHYHPLQVSEEMDLVIWGVVTSVVHSV